MTDLEFKFLFSVMAGCGYKLFLSTEYMLLDFWHDRFLQHILEMFYEHLFGTIYFFFIRYVSLVNNPSRMT